LTLHDETLIKIELITNRERAKHRIFNSMCSVPCSDILFSLIRISIAVATIYFLGWIYGLAALITFKFVLYIFMFAFFRMEACWAMDELFLHDSENNRSNITSKALL